MRRQHIRPQSAQVGLEMSVDLADIRVDRGFLNTNKVIGCPDVQPLAQRRLAWLNVRALIDLTGQLTQFFRCCPLCLAGDGRLNLLARADVITRSETGLPIVIFLAAARYGLLSDRACARNCLCVFCIVIAARRDDLLSVAQQGSCMIVRCAALCSHPSDTKFV